MSFSGADLIAKGLAEYGVRHVFAIVSIHNMPILDAINRLGKTAIIDVRHEQAGTHAADGYARATGRTGVMIASTGPGTTNTVTGLYEAQAASSPVLVITGQAETAFYGRGLSYVHEAENQKAMLETVCRRVESPRHAGDVGEAFVRVLRDMHCGRRAPGALEIPIDLQYAEAPDMVFPPLPEGAFTADASLIGNAAEMIANARRRIIVAGGGVIAAGAEEQLQALATLLDAPVITTVDGRGVLREDHPLCVGNYWGSAGISQAIAEGDLTIAVGTKFAVGVSGRGARFTPPGALVHIDIDPAMVGRTHPAVLGVVADARSALEGLLANLGEVSGNDAQFNQTVWEARDGVRGAMRKRLGPDFARIMDLMREALPEDGLFCRDSTIAAYNFGNQLFPVFEPRTSINSSSGAIGPGLPFAIGGAVGTGKRALLMNGDGGFMLHATELATAAQYRIPVLVCVFNDGGYGVLRWLQDTRFGRINETDLGKMDFAGMAAGMGVPGERVRSVDAFEEALRRGMATDGPYLLDVDMSCFAPMENSIPPKNIPVEV